MEYKYINLNYLMSSSKNVAFYKKMFELFRTSVKDYSNKLQSALKDKDFEELGKVAHKAKSAVSIVGMDKMQLFLSNLEKDAYELKNIETFENRVSYFIEKANEAISEINDAEKFLKE